LNDRLATTLGALAAVLIVSALLFSGGRAAPASRPTSADTGANGYAALWRWLNGEGVAVHSLRRRVNTSADWRPEGPAGGHLFITTMPHRERMRLPEIRALEEWLADGNTLLVLAALDDTPDWTRSTDTTYFLDDLTRLTGLEFRVAEEAAVTRIGTPGSTGEVFLQGIRAHPLMTDVVRLKGETDDVASIWAAEPEAFGRLVIKLATEEVSGAPALWQAAVGEGHVIVSGLGSLLGNRAIGAADNRRFVINLLRHHLGRDGQVIFDDMHQGLSALYDPEALFSDPRLGATLAFLIAFWLIYLLGSASRLAGPATRLARPDQSGFVTGAAGFLARKLSPAQAGRLMLEHWFEELRGQGLLPPGTASPWPALQAVTALGGEPLARLQRFRQTLENGGRVDLRELHNTLRELRGMLR